MRSLSLLIVMFCFAYASGQSFTSEATIPDVKKDAFYRILISPDLSPYLNSELSDIRIYDGESREVPYLLQKETPAYHSANFLEYEIIKKESKRGCCTSLILRNPDKTPINNIHLTIKNADASRDAALLGSDDNKNWFAIKDHFTLSAPATSHESQEAKIVGFPWSNYEFYLLDINDSIHAPLNIIAAGYYKEQSTYGRYQTLAAEVTSADSVAQKKTYVKVLLNSLQFVDKMEITVSGAKYYRRNATLYEKRVRIGKNGKRIEYYNEIENFELTSGRSAVIELSNVRAQEFLISIDNQDNPPLSLSEVKVFQLNRYLTTWLEQDESYSLKFGQRQLTAPNYDLKYFRDSIPDHVAILEVANIKKLDKTEAEVSDTFFNSKAFIWIAIVAVMLVLGVMSVKMVREASQAEEKK